MVMHAVQPRCTDGLTVPSSARLWVLAPGSLTVCSRLPDCPIIRGRRRHPLGRYSCSTSAYTGNLTVAASICQHGRWRSDRKECGGSSICQHGRWRSDCKECGVNSICQHGWRRSDCKECGVNSICQHGRRRSDYKACGVSSICQHGWRRRDRKACAEK